MSLKRCQNGVQAGDPWYTKDQFSWLDQPHVRRTIERRQGWIDAEITSYQHQMGRQLRVLDVGCGDGLLLMGLVSLDVELWAVDLNELRIRRARDRVPSVKFCLGNATCLGFQSGSFDVVIASHLLEHLNDDQAGLAELARVLTPRGLLLIGVPNEGSFLGWLRNHIIQRNILRETDHRQFYTRRRFEQRLRQHSFRITAVLCENFFVPCTHLFEVLHRPLWGWKAMDWLARRLPSQCAGLFLACVRSGFSAERGANIGSGYARE